MRYDISIEWVPTKSHAGKFRRDSWAVDFWPRLHAAMVTEAARTASQWLRIRADKLEASIADGSIDSEEAILEGMAAIDRNRVLIAPVVKEKKSETTGKD